MNDDDRDTIFLSAINRHLFRASLKYPSRSNKSIEKYATYSKWIEKWGESVVAHVCADIFNSSSDRFLKYFQCIQLNGNGEQTFLSAWAGKRAECFRTSITPHTIYHNFQRFVDFYLLIEYYYSFKKQLIGLLQAYFLFKSKCDFEISLALIHTVFKMKTFACEKFPRQSKWLAFCEWFTFGVIIMPFRMSQCRRCRFEPDGVVVSRFQWNCRLEHVTGNAMLLRMPLLNELLLIHALVGKNAISARKIWTLEKNS